MFFDEEYLKIILKNFKLEPATQLDFIRSHYETITEIIIMKVLNYYSLQNSDEEVKRLEKLVKDINKTGRVEYQKEFIDIIQNTIKKYPKLTEEINEAIAALNSKMMFDFLEKADEESQLELLTHLMRKTAEVKRLKEKVKEFNKP